MPPRKRNSIEVGALHIHTDIMVRGKSIVRAKVLWIKKNLLTILYAYPDMSAITNGLFYINEKTNNRTSCFCIRLKDVQIDHNHREKCVSVSLNACKLTLIPYTHTHNGTGQEYCTCPGFSWCMHA